MMEFEQFVPFLCFLVFLNGRPTHIIKSSHWQRQRREGLGSLYKMLLLKVIKNGICCRVGSRSGSEW